MQWYHDIPFWKPIDKQKNNFVTDFSPKMQKCLGVQNVGNEGAAKFLDFDFFE